MFYEIEEHMHIENDTQELDLYNIEFRILSEKPEKMFTLRCAMKRILCLRQHPRGFPLQFISLIISLRDREIEVSDRKANGLQAGP